MPTEAELRQARLAEIRRQIAEGTYETPEKIAAAVEKMLSRWADEAAVENQGTPRTPK